MGKINGSSPAIEIIPLDDSKSVNQREGFAARSRTSLHLNPRLKMHKMPYMSDPTLVPRVQKYLASNMDQKYVDINLMADNLQRKYKEYARRKRSAFRGAVKKAYAIVLRSYGISDQDPSSDDLSDGSAIEEEGFQENSLSTQLIEMYSRPLITKPTTPVNENELIDISSDDSNDQAPQNNVQSTNGASTSVRSDEEHSPQHSENENLNVGKRIEPNKVANKLPQLLQFNDRTRKRKLAKDVAASGPAKKKRSAASLHEPSATFKNLGGLDSVLEDVCKLLVHVRHPEVYWKIGVVPPRGFLLHGPPGCGKTLLAHAIAGELNVPLLKVSAPELVAGVSGESEERIRELFERAVASTPCVLFIDEIDAITQNRQNAQKEMERRIVAQLLTCIDDLNYADHGDGILVIGATNRPDSIDPALRRAGRFDREVCLGIPNVHARKQILQVVTSGIKLEEDIDFDELAKLTPGFVGADLTSLTREAAMAAVNRVFRDLKDKHQLQIAMDLQNQLNDKQTQDTNTHDGSKSEEEIIVDGDPPKPDPPIDNPSNSQLDNSGNVVVIDDDSKPNTEDKPPVNNITEPPVQNVVENATPKTVLEELLSWLHDQSPLPKEQLSQLFVTMDDFRIALKSIQPSAKREGFATVPDVTWDDVGSLQDIREELKLSILAPVQHAEQFEALGINSPTGVLLCGPPGCGKTLLAKAIANEAGINFISVKGPELLNMYVGESERGVRTCFERARNSAPCVIFFDELDALCPKRSDSREGGATMRVVNQMLTEMDGIEGRKDVFLLAASNRPDIIDPAVLRPGRLDKILYVGLPSASDRVDILRALTKNGRKPPLAPFVDLEAIGKSEQLSGYTGADLAALVRETGVIALKEYMLEDSKQPLVVTSEHFKKAISKIRPSVSEKDQKHYEKLRKMYAATSADNEVEEMEYS